jgi:hypothetical protein
MDRKAQFEPSPSIWSQQVLIRWESGNIERISGPKAALRVLEHKWPASRGVHYHTAKAACIGAIDRKCSVELARETFVEAAARAAILV